MNKFYSTVIFNLLVAFKPSEAGVGTASFYLS